MLRRLLTADTLESFPISTDAKCSLDTLCVSRALRHQNANRVRDVERCENRLEARPVARFPRVCFYLRELVLLRG